LTVARKGTSLLATIVGIGWAAEAHAQRIPEIAIALAVSPLILFVLSVVLAVVAKSLKLGLKSVLLCVFWVAWFILASKFIESDAIIWAPIIGLGIHLFVLVIFIGWRLVSRVWTPRRDA
jgi:FtsH-binding integral membrane protein